MATVPVNYCRFLPVEMADEIGAMLGVGWDIGDGVAVSHPAVGHWSMMELLDTKLFSGGAVDPLDLLRVGYVLKHGRDAAKMVCDHARARKLQTTFDQRHRWTLLDESAASWGRRSFPTLGGPDARKMRELISLSFAGFSLIPEDRSGGRLWLFAGEGLAGVLHSCRCLNLPPDRVLWEIPLTTVGHLVASSRHANGEPVARQRDPADVRRQLKLTREREAAGVLHPWQIERPDVHSLSKEQVEARPELETIHRFLMEARNVAV